ncbi:MAG: hypothetical protein JW910_00990 [Anaerolineae bacterium]|nr:hypothetical protein [Anaerolineae bacterium]
MSARGTLSPLEVALAFLIGVGFILMALAGAIGATFGAVATETLYGVLFVLGLVTFVAGVVLWLVTIKPWTQFDDITVPKDSGHHHAASHDEAAASH